MGGLRGYKGMGRAVKPSTVEMAECVTLGA